MAFESGQRIRLPDEPAFVLIEDALGQGDGGWKLYVRADGDDTLRKVALSAAEAGQVEVLVDDGGADPNAVLAGLWAMWMRDASTCATATALASMPLDPYPHQNRAIYGAMLPQPLLRFLLADEPGTGKTIMGGLYLREAQRLGFVKRALIVVPAHLVSKWQADFERFLGGGLRQITAATIREHALATEHDLWVVSLELAAMNPAVYEAIHPDRAGWDAVVFDEAHRLTPTALTYYSVGRMLAASTPRAILMTATPHRGNEWLFRSLMHLTDPTVFPEVERIDLDQPANKLRPGALHFLRRMKEELVDYDGMTPLFRGRRAHNLKIPLNVDERTFYNEALDLVEDYFPPMAVELARMVYGKRAASSLYALAETLRRRRDGMGTRNPADAAYQADPEGDDEAAQDLAKVVHENSKASREEKKEIDRLLERLQAVLGSPDVQVSKWPRMVTECLVPNGIAPGNDEQLVVFTEFADTADWLVARFRAEGHSAERYSGRDPHWRRDAIRAQFAAREFQVLVSTDAGNEGIDLQTAHVLVNWDIPWSLVRLEQRMGRIHRVGQTHNVELYNLIAIDTREGVAHAQLLDNLVAAANELGGKIFDSLSLVGEIAMEEAGIGSLEELLANTYKAHEDRSMALGAIRAITKDRIRAIHQRSRAAEDALASGVDLASAVAALHTERLERVNPHVVERFLARVQTAGLIRLEMSALSEEGFYVLSPAALGPLPDELHVQDGSVLVVTSGQAKKQAIGAGQTAAARAVGLGPSDAAFRCLIDAVASRLDPSLYRGGNLHDPSSVTDYDLFCFEVGVREGGGRRISARWYLVRVDDVGARPVAWELLANLEPGTGPVKGAHPARATDAEHAARRAVEDDLAKHRSVFTDWLQNARVQLERLPNDLTDAVPARKERLATRSRLRATVDERLQDLETAVHIEAGEVRRVGWAHVTGTQVPLDPIDKDSEAVAMRHVAELLRADGWAVADVHNERPGRGFDLHAYRRRRQRCVEVKGVWDSATSRGITLTGNELATAYQLGDDYWLYVVEQCHDGKGRLYAAYQDPAVVFAGATRDIAVLHINGLDLKAAKEAQVA